MVCFWRTFLFLLSEGLNTTVAASGKINVLCIVLSLDFFSAGEVTFHGCEGGRCEARG